MAKNSSIDKTKRHVILSYENDSHFHFLNFEHLEGDTMERTTKNRESILKIIESSEVPLTAYDISNRCKISLPTIYRALNFLARNGDIRSFTLDHYAYYYSSAEHKHFFRCTTCERLFPLYECSIEDYEKHLEDRMGINIDEHFILFTGTCQECLQQR